MSSSIPAHSVNGFLRSQITKGRRNTSLIYLEIEDWLGAMSIERLPCSTFLAVAKPLGDDGRHGWFCFHTALTAEKLCMRFVHGETLHAYTSIPD